MILAQAFAFVRNLFVKSDIGPVVQTAYEDMTGFPNLFFCTIGHDTVSVTPMHGANDSARFSSLHGANDSARFSSLHATNGGLRLFGSTGLPVILNDQERRHLRRALQFWLDVAPSKNFRFVDSSAIITHLAATAPGGVLALAFR